MGDFLYTYVSTNPRDTKVMPTNTEQLSGKMTVNDQIQEPSFLGQYLVRPLNLH